MSTAEPQNLMEVLARLESLATPKGGNPSKNRKFHRYSVRANARLEAIDAESLDEPSTVLLRDMSRAGVGFLVDRFLEPNSMWRMRFLAADCIIGAQPILVRFCRLVQDNLFIAGGQFVVEPFIMQQLGISRHRLQDEQLREYSDADVSAFLTPDDDLSP